ncbi:unnamed protein product [Vicia faba]|uniref:Uncharacterized protein n=1 Tax=Vicia faba TaxID=3906 RepID=A0AAV0ZRV5_VICFA|nr:unnamed protein product [Vicia faba]
MNDFFNWSDGNHFIHLPTVCNFFTWYNGRKGNQLIEKRRDRVLCNVDLFDACNIAVCNTLTKYKSDHYPLMLTCNFEKVHFRSRFKFLKMWSLNDDCSRVIKSSWDTMVTSCLCTSWTENLEF